MRTPDEKAEANELAADQRELEALIDEAGGLWRVRSVARLMQLSRTRARQLSERQDFPRPMLIDGVEHWTAAEVTHWQETIGSRRRAGRPRQETSA